MTLRLIVTYQEQDHEIFSEGYLARVVFLIICFHMTLKLPSAAPTYRLIRRKKSYSSLPVNEGNQR